MDSDFDTNLSKDESSEIRSDDAPVLSGTEIGGATPVNVSNRSFDAEIATGSTILNTVLAWIEGLRMRLKIKKDLGRTATETDLTSIDTWMKVDEAEEMKGLKKPPNLG
jgi:hypothetical protein